MHGRKVVVLGLARQGTAAARYLCNHGANVTVSDMASEESLRTEIEELSDLPISFILGSHPVELLDGCELLVLSGGVPPQIPLVQEAIARAIPLSNDALLTLHAMHARGLGTVAAITGSSGKTTTTSLAGLMMAESASNVHVGGNIGVPLLDKVDSIGRSEPVILELSSFQLELFDQELTHSDIAGIGPQYALITNITPNHLDRHASMAAYVAAKLNLIRTMPSGATLVLNIDDPVAGTLFSDKRSDRGDNRVGQWGLHETLEDARSRIRNTRIETAPYSMVERLESGAWLDGDELIVEGEVICRRQEIKMRGEHNSSNLLGAALLSRRCGAKIEAIRHVAITFEGVAHRLEVVLTHGGITWVNDSIATAPERAVAALRSFDDPNRMLILLAGGKDKNLPWETFSEEVIRRVSFLIGFGDSGAMIVNSVQEQARFDQKQAPACATVSRLEEAVTLASKVAVPGAVVLLSPGGTSFDAYKNFEERGEHFRRLVSDLAKGDENATSDAAPVNRSGDPQ